MNKLKYLVLAFFSLSIMFSCNKDIDENKVDDLLEINAEIDLRNDDCRTCEAVDITLTPDQNGDKCCRHILKIVSNVEPCRQHIYLNGALIGFVTEWVQEIPIETCKGETNVIEVYGFDLNNDNWEVLCFSETITCEDCVCPDIIPYSIDLVSQSPDGCCKYEVNVYPQPPSVNNCELTLEIGNQSYSIGDIALCLHFEICEGEELDVTLYSGDVVCNKETLDCKKCEGLDVTVTALGSPIGSSCCEYRVSVSNSTNCDMGVYDQNDNLVFLIGMATGAQQIITVCPSNGIFQSFTVRCKKGKDVCEEFILPTTCFEQG